MKTLAEIEHDTIVDAVGECNGDRRLAASYLGIGKTTLYRKMKEYGIPPLYSRRSLVRLAASLRHIRQPRFLLMPRTPEEQAAADLTCPNCHKVVLLPNGAHQ